MAPRKPGSLRYIVTGPGLEVEPSYDSIGTALSRSITAACKASKEKQEGTWYVRDSLKQGDVLGYSESKHEGTLIVTVAHPYR